MKLPNNWEKIDNKKNPKCDNEKVYLYSEDSEDSSIYSRNSRNSKKELIVYVRESSDGVYADVLDGKALRDDNSVDMDPGHVQRMYGDGGYLYTGNEFSEAEERAKEFIFNF